MIYIHENGVTVVATDEAKRGKVYELNGEKYYVARGVSDITVSYTHLRAHET